jgi:hypothetical protein
MAVIDSNNPSILLWGFADSKQLVIVEAVTAKEALAAVQKYWLEGQTIVPLAFLPLDAPQLVHRPMYLFDRDFIRIGKNDFFFEWLKYLMERTQK